MNRLQKKCLIASAATHLLLLALLLVSPAFVPSRRETELPRLTFIPLKLTDDPFSGGGAAQASAPPAQVTLPATPPPAPLVTPTVPVLPPREPDPVPPESKPVQKPERKPPIAKPRTKEPATQPEPSKPTSAKPSKTPPPKHEIKPNFTKSTDTARAAAEERARAKAEADARAAQAKFREQISKLGEKLSQGLSSATSIEMPGPGTEAYANYIQVVKTMYQNAWLPPEDFSDDTATVQAKVIILRDGKVKSATITRPSGIRRLDDSVRRALALPEIRPFPEGAKDTERPFILEFNLKNKRSYG